LAVLNAEFEAIGWTTSDNTETVFSHAIYSRLAAEDLPGRPFSAVMARASGRATVVGPQGPEDVLVELVSGNYFDGLGVHAHVGRTFGPSDDSLSATQTAVMLSYSYWQSRFAGDPGVIGSSIVINGMPAVIVGIIPAEFPRYAPRKNAANRGTSSFVADAELGFELVEHMRC
jgi:hypothetical protein